MIRRIVLFLLFLFAISLSILSYLKMDTAMNRATLHLQKGVSYAQAEEYLRQEEEQTEKVRALFFQKNTSADMGFSVDADILEICGDARLLTNGMETLAKEDVEGVLISEALAQELFRSSKVQGSQITLDAKTYTVRGVYAEPEKQLIRLNREEDMLFHQVRVQKQGNKTAETTLQEFTQRYGLSGNTLQWTEYVGVVKGILLLSLGVLAILLWSWGRGVMHGDSACEAMHRDRERHAGLALKIVRILYVGIVVLLLWRQIHIPDTMIPAKWSDFAYWGNWFQSVRTNVGNVFLLEKIGYEQRVLMHGLWSMIGSVGMVVLLYLNLFCKKMKRFMRVASNNRFQEIKELAGLSKEELRSLIK